LTIHVKALTPKGLNVCGVTKPVWVVSLDLTLFLDI
jgi:hypothetical protein